MLGQIEEHEGDQQEQRRRREHDARMQRETATRDEVATPKPDRAEVVDHKEADAAQNHLDAHRQQDERLVAKHDKASRIERESRVRERHHGIEERPVPGRTVAQGYLCRRRVAREKPPKRHSAQRLYDEHRRDYPNDQAAQTLHAVRPVGAHQRELAGQRKAPSDHHQEKRTHRHDADTSQFDQRQHHALSEERQLRTRLDDRKSRDADRRTGREQRVAERTPRVRGARDGERQEKRTQQNRPEEAQHDQPADLHAPSPPSPASPGVSPAGGAPAADASAAAGASVAGASAAGGGSSFFSDEAVKSSFSLSHTPQTLIS